MKTLNRFGYLAALVVSLTACGSGANNDSTQTAAAPTPASAGSAQSGLNAECDAYVARVDKCMDKLGAGNPVAATYKQQMDATKAQWAAVQDKATMASICKQANDAFTQTAQTLKCE